MSSPSPPDASMSPSPQSRLQDTSAMILSWLRSAVPLILRTSSHTTTKPPKEHPIQSLTNILSESIVLADLVSYLDPTRLSPTNILRATPRNALSTPLPTPHTTTKPVDTRQKSVVYEANTRRILYAVRKILEDVRTFTRTPPPPHTGALDAFLGDVTKTPPALDIRPALQLAQVIIACASYGPRHNEFRHAIWQFDTELLRAAFVSSMKSVAIALSLPTPDVLFATSHSPIPSPPLLSPAQPSPYSHGAQSPQPPFSPHQPFSPQHPFSPTQQFSPQHPFSPPQMFSPPGRLMTPPVATSSHPGHVTPPLQPFPYPVSPPPPVPRAPLYQKPPLPMSPRATLAPHIAGATARSPIPAAVPPPVITPSYAAPHLTSPASPRYASPTQSPTVSRSPRFSSPRKSGSASSSSRSSPRTLPKQAAANPHVNTSSRSVVSPRTAPSSRKPPSPQKVVSPDRAINELRQQTSNVTDPGVMADLAGSVAAGTAAVAVGVAAGAAAALFAEGTSALPTHQSQDSGIGLRKISTVTEECTSPTGVDVSTARSVGNRDAAARGIGEERVTPGVAEMVQQFEEGSNNSRRSSEEFYTPKEAVSPVPSPLPDDHRITEESVSEEQPRASSSARPPKYNPPSEQYGTGRVDEIVRQSVTSSVMKQFTQPDKKETSEEPRDSRRSRDYSSSSREVGTTSATSSVCGPESYRSVDFSDPRFMQTPLEAPSPSNRWNISHQKDVCEGIMSPQPLFSPPQMPQRLRRSTASTQMTPPVAKPQAPTLFRSGSVSSQYSYASAGGGYDGPSAAEQGELNKNQKVSFAPVITTPGGREKPLGKPLKESDPQRNEQPSQQTQGFSLPPNAGREEGQAVSPDLGGRSEEEFVHNEPVDDGLQIYDDRDDEAHGEVLSDEGTGRAGLSNNSDSEENLSDKGTFEEVEEYVVYNSDEQTDDFLAGEEEPRFVQEEVLASSCEFDLANEAEGQTQLLERVTQTSPDRNDRGITEGASLPQQHPDPTSRENEEVGDSRLPPARSSEPNLGASERPPRLVRRPMSYSTPGYGRIPRGDVPPTPPSPPTIESLVRSFGDAKRLPDSIASHPVSTMEPSVGLFEKLISVLKTTDDDQRTELSQLSQSQIVVEGLPREAVSSDPPASQSTQDSTLRSGDTETQSHEISPSLSASRSRRPRAVRLPEGLKSHQHLSSSFATREEESKSPEGDKLSVASFSDSFPSEDKDHPEEEATEEWEAAMRGHRDAGVPVSSTQKRSGSAEKQTQTSGTQRLQGDDDLIPPSPSMVQRKTKSYSTSTGPSHVVPEDHLVRVDRRRLDWLTRQLLAARDAISRKDLQMTFAETERAEQREILLLEKEDAESVVGAMKKLLADRETELQTARDRLSVAIEGVVRDRSSLESKTSAGGDGQGLHDLIKEGHTKLHEHIDSSDAKQREVHEASGELKELLVGVQSLLGQMMDEMTEKRDAELEALRSDLRTREKLVADLQKSSADLMSQNREIQSETSAVRLEKERSDHRYKMEMSHVSAQVELVNEFSKKLHDNFRETENLRQQVLHYQDKLSQISSTSGISKRQIKELREAVTRANDECSRLRREADSEKRKRMEAIRRAEELEDLRMNDDAVQVQSRYPDRMDRTDSGSYRSHEPVRPAGHNRPGGSGVNARYHARARGMPGSPTTAQKAWLVIKDKIGGIVTGNNSGTSRRRGPGHSGRRDYSKGGGSSQSSHSQSRSRGSRDDDRSRSGSLRSRSSQGSGSSVRSGPQRSNRSGGSGGRRGSPVENAGQFMHAQPYGHDEVGRIRAADF